MSDPFLEYLTVFRARLGAVNIVLGLTGLSHLPEQAVLRKTRNILELKVSLSLIDKNNDFVFSYLKDKGLVHDNLGASGRYEGFALIKQGDAWCAKDKRGNNLDNLSVFQTDLWMADPKFGQLSVCQRKRQGDCRLHFSISSAIPRKRHLDFGRRTFNSMPSTLPHNSRR